MLKILVVEDEELIRKGIVLAVDWAALDCVVVGEASNGEEALAAVERLSPSLIITDLKMPRMDGIEMLRRLREAGNPVYVIILTAYDSFSYAQSALRLGAVDFLLKPFHDGELEQAVRNLQSRMQQKEAVHGIPGLKKEIRANMSWRPWIISAHITMILASPWGVSHRAWVSARGI